MEERRNYRRFWGALRHLPGADKDMLVEQYTGGRTTRLHETTAAEYSRMCADLEREAGLEAQRAVWEQARRKKRSLCLHLMQKLGVDTSDWSRVDALCLDRRLMGTRFAYLSCGDLDLLARKLRAIGRHGGLRAWPEPHFVAIQIENITNHLKSKGYDKEN